MSSPVARRTLASVDVQGTRAKNMASELRQLATAQRELHAACFRQTGPPSVTNSQPYPENPVRGSCAASELLFRSKGVGGGSPISRVEKETPGTQARIDVRPAQSLGSKIRPETGPVQKTGN